MNVKQKLIDLNHKNNELTLKEINGTLTGDDVLEALDKVFYLEEHELDEYGMALYEEIQILKRFTKKYDVEFI